MTGYSNNKLNNIDVSPWLSVTISDHYAAGSFGG
jgi:hypothetical protein